MEDLSLGTTAPDAVSSDSNESGGIACALADAPGAGKTTQDLLSEFRSRGRQDCFEELVRRYGAMVLHVCRQVTRDRHDAEDATQVAFLILAERLRAGETIHSL